MTDGQIKAMENYINVSVELNRKLTPKFIKINDNYLNDFVLNERVKSVNFSHEGTTVDFDGIIQVFEDVPLVFDENVDTIEFAYAK